MNVLMFGWEFPPFNSGGLGTACEGLTKGLYAKGVNVALVLPKKINSEVNFVRFVYPKVTENFLKSLSYVNSIIHPYITSDEYNNKIEMIRDTCNNKGIYGRNLLEEVENYAEKARAIVENEDFDIIHAHDWLTYKAGIIAKQISGKPLVAHIHATEFDRTGGHSINQNVYEIEKQGLEAADLVIAVSNYTKNHVAEKYGVPKEKIRVVHNAVEHPNYTIEKASELKKTKKVVLFLGRLTLQKGPEYFLYTAKRVLDIYPDTIFICAGSGDMERFLIEKAAELGISDRFLFAGFVRGDTLEQAYNLADLYVMPSVSEPFGITALESMIRDTPAIISKQSGVAEVVTHCLKIDFWDIDEMANKIISVLEHPELHETLKENGKREVSKINWENSAETCLNVYKEVLAR